MVITQISVTYGRKFNLGNYESAEIACSLWGQIDETEDASACMGELWQTAKAAVKEQALPLVKDRPNFKAESAGKKAGQN